MKTALEVNVGMKFCKDCEYNLRCAECIYKKEYEGLAGNHDILLEQADKLQKEVDCLRKKVQYARIEATKAFAEKLCQDKLSNDPVVIAVKTELEMVGVENDR